MSGTLFSRIVRLLAQGDLLLADFLAQLPVGPLAARRDRGYRVLLKDLSQLAEQPGGSQQKAGALGFPEVIQEELCVWITLLRRCLKPAVRLFPVPLHILSHEIQLAQSVLGEWTALFGGGCQILQRLCHIFWNLFPLEIQLPQPIGGSRIPLSRRFFVTGDRFLSGLPLYNEQGQKLCYYAVETAINGEPLRTADDGCYLIKIGETDYHFRFSAATTTTGTCKTTLTNIGYTDITGKKIWKDNSNAYETRPDSISLTLWRKAGTTGTPEPVTDPEGKPVQPTWSIPETGNEWTFTYTHLPEANNQGAAYIYEVKEAPVALRSGDTYVSVIDDMQLTNTLTGTVNLSVEKLWQDNENASGLRPDEIQVQLLANGVPDESHILTLNEGNSWKAILNGLPKYDANGALIRYSFAETELPDGYRVVYDQPVTGTPGADSDLSFRITNVADGDVILTKTVSGSRGDTSKAFTFTLDTGMTSTSPADAYPYTIRRQDGTEETGVIRSGETFTLRHNEEIHIEELPGNAAYLFTESDNAGYRVTQSGTSGIILPGGTIHASFENYRSGGDGGGHHDPDPDPKDPPREPDGELPHTGQDWRTAGLLAAGGVILLDLGLFGRRKPDEPSQSE